MLLVGLRDVLNANVPLVLTLVVVAVAGAGGRQTGVVAAVSSALWFDFFHTQPYLQLRIASGDAWRPGSSCSSAHETLQRSAVVRSHEYRLHRQGLQLAPEGVALEVLVRGLVVGRFLLEPSARTGVSLEADGLIDSIWTVSTPASCPTRALPILPAVSDNGAPVTAVTTKAFMAPCSIAQHFGRPGVPTDQAPIESFFGHVHAEWPHGRPSATLRSWRRVRAEYNSVHAAIDYVTPYDEHAGR